MIGFAGLKWDVCRRCYILYAMRFATIHPERVGERSAGMERPPVVHQCLRSSHALPRGGTRGFLSQVAVFLWPLRTTSSCCGRTPVSAGCSVSVRAGVRVRRGRSESGLSMRSCRRRLAILAGEWDMQGNLYRGDDDGNKDAQSVCPSVTCLRTTTDTAVLALQTSASKAAAPQVLARLTHVCLTHSTRHASNKLQIQDQHLCVSEVL